MSAFLRPDQVLVGLEPLSGGLAVLDLQSGRGIAAECRALWSCTTWSELLAVVPALRHVRPDVGGLGEQFDGDTPIDWEQIPGFADGDWRPLPTAAILRLFAPDDAVWADLARDAGGTRVATTLNDDLYEIAADRDAGLIEVLARHGMEVVRDDAAVASMNPLGDTGT